MFGSLRVPWVMATCATLVVWITTAPAAAQPRHEVDLCARRGSSSGFWSDAYLAAFARAGRHRFATFDRGFRRFIGQRPPVPVPAAHRR